MEELTPTKSESMADLGEKIVTQAEEKALPARRCELCKFFKDSPGPGFPTRHGNCHGMPPQTPGSHHATGVKWERPVVAAVDLACTLFQQNPGRKNAIEFAAAKPAGQ